MQTPPLFVDLDGTLIKTDLLIESALALLKRAPWMLFPMILWMLRGKARLKFEIAQRVDLDVDVLPFQRGFLKWLHEQAEAGRDLWLATASDRRLAEAVAERAGIFRGVLASDGKRNLRSEEKLKAIQQVSGGAYDYAGNARADYPVWAQARRAIVVNPGLGVEAGARVRSEVEHVFEDRPPAWRAWVRATRVYQWLKNLLIFVPLLTAHAFDAASMLALVPAFFAFSFVASATYLFNDLLDLASDRAHPRKCRRPLAAGDIGIASGVLAAALLLCAGFALGGILGGGFLVTLLLYLIVTVAYSAYFKQYMLIDVLMLAGLYTLRILAGAEAINVEVSSWLLAYSMFVFLSLALVKRCSELIAMGAIDREHARGRDYRRSDSPTVIGLGTASAYLSVLVLALYIDSPFVREHYREPALLWLICPVMLYWMSRLWMKTTRGEMHDDPILFSLKDRGSWASFLAVLAVMVGAL